MASLFKNQSDLGKAESLCDTVCEASVSAVFLYMISYTCFEALGEKEKLYFPLGFPRLPRLLSVIFRNISSLELYKYH